jgi:hypothetical protein
MKTNIFFASIFLALLLLNGCASLTGYQDAKAVGKSKVEGGLSINISKSPDFISEDIDDSLGVDNGITFPNVELFGRYGVTDKLDIGAKLNSNLNLSITSKYQLLGDKYSKTAVAVGAEFGTFGLITNLWNIQLPLYLSVHPMDNLSIYLSPKYIYQFGVGDLTNESLSYIGGNSGILFGKKNKFGIDFGYYRFGGLDTFSKGIYTIGVGGKFLISGGDDEDDNLPVEKKKRKKRKK